MGINKQEHPDTPLLNPKDLQTIYLGIILHNPGTQSVKINVLQAASHLTKDSPYIKLPNYV
ncbi:MAG TPA: hypothetical protein DDW76_10210 [Cyanobacteria bacterium UBA11369]|nr:hypothetical protein [Cyanobacteria bacterium UBA11371]HBE19409.1 hypothetical protein [Cyanobacteria bacterium UBA11367]HBE34650.1 hypothetical protein [Cyanobacteria bacterium UBA11368]HBE49147.1 hypothetical protein [Cyanobacteria bacterium UBA11369]